MTRTLNRKNTTSSMFDQALVGSHPMAISANNITLFNLTQKRPCCHSVNAVQFIFFRLSFSMVEVHYIERVLNSAVSTRA